MDMNDFQNIMVDFLCKNPSLFIFSEHFLWTNLIKPIFLWPNPFFVNKSDLCQVWSILKWILVGFGHIWLDLVKFQPWQEWSQSSVVGQIESNHFKCIMEGFYHFFHALWPFVIILVLRIAIILHMASKNQSKSDFGIILSDFDHFWLDFVWFWPILADFQKFSKKFLSHQIFFQSFQFWSIWGGGHEPVLCCCVYTFCLVVLLCLQLLVCCVAVSGTFHLLCCCVFDFTSRDAEWFLRSTFSYIFTKKWRFFLKHIQVTWDTPFDSSIPSLPKSKIFLIVRNFYMARNFNEVQYFGYFWNFTFWSEYVTSRIFKRIIIHM